MFVELIQYRKCLLLLIIVVVGCNSTSKERNHVQRESRDDAESAIQSVVGAISGKDVGSEGIKDLTQQLRKDEEAQEAVGVIADSLGGQGRRVKYCPVTGKRYSPKFEICPDHNVKLEEVEE